MRNDSIPNFLLLSLFFSSAFDSLFKYIHLRILNLALFILECITRRFMSEREASPDPKRRRPDDDALLVDTPIPTPMLSRAYRLRLNNLPKFMPPNDLKKLIAKQGLAHPHVKKAPKWDYAFLSFFVSSLSLSLLDMIFIWV